MKKVHFLQQVSFEGPGYIKDYCRNKGFLLDGTMAFGNKKFPEIDDIDLLVVLGGPMSVNDDLEWIAAELNFIKKYIASKKPVIGICLGAQLLAKALGARVYKNKFREIGWYPVKRTESAGQWSFSLPESFYAFHWHGETFDIPEGAVRLASSIACENQAFVYEKHILGLQFHLETMRNNMHLLVEHAREEIDGSRFVQNPEEIIIETYLHESNQLMSEIFDFYLK